MTSVFIIVVVGVDVVIRQIVEVVFLVKVVVVVVLVAVVKVIVVVVVVVLPEQHFLHRCKTISNSGRR